MSEKEIAQQIAVLADQVLQTASETLIYISLRTAPLYGGVQFKGNKEAVKKQIAEIFTQQLKSLLTETDPRKIKTTDPELYIEQSLLEMFIEVEEVPEADFVCELIIDLAQLLREYRLIYLYAMQLANGAPVKEVLRAEINTLVSIYDACAMSIKTAVKKMPTALNQSDFKAFNSGNNIDKLVALKNKLFE